MKSIEELRDICLRATPGPWIEARKTAPAAGEYDSVFVDTDEDNSDCICRDAEGNAEFIAQFNPAFVLKLLDVVEALKYHIEQTRPIRKSTDALAELEKTE